MRKASAARPDEQHAGDARPLHVGRPAKICLRRRLACSRLVFLHSDWGHAMFGITDTVTFTIASAVLVALLNLKGLLFFPSMMVQLVAALFLAFAAKLWTA